MSADTEGLREIHTEPTDPMALPIPKKCPEAVDYDLLDAEDNMVGEGTQACGLDLVYERHGDEVVYMCTEHGWQATVFEERTDD